MWKPLIEEIRRRRTSYAPHKRLLRSFPEQRRPRWSAVRDCRRAFSGSRPESSCWPLSGSPYRLHPPRTRRPENEGIPRDEGLLGVQGRRRQLLHDQVLERQGTPGRLEDLLSAGGRQDCAEQRYGHLRRARQHRGRPLPPSFRDRGRTVHDLGRHGNARRVPCPRPRHGRFVDSGPVALGRDLQLRSGLDPVGNRPVSERVARRLSSLSAKYIAVFALLVAVPVICTSVYLLYSSYQDNKRALTRLQQEKAKSVSVTIDQYFKDVIARMRSVQGQYLSFTAQGATLAPLLETDATAAFYIDGAGRKTLATAGGGLPRPRGDFSHRAERGAGEGDRGLLRPSVRSADPVQPWSTSDGGRRSRGVQFGGLPGNTVDSSARRWI